MKTETLNINKQELNFTTYQQAYIIGLITKNLSIYTKHVST